MRQQAAVNIVVLGLTVSSSWGNGHATLWRALGRALAARGHRVTFFERDVPYYAAHRDGVEFPGIDLRLYRNLAELRGPLSAHLAGADVAMVTSFCPQGGALARLICDAPRPLHVFYDLDTPVTLAKLEAGDAVDYLPAAGLRDFDLVLSYTGGRALDALRTRLGARRTAPLYGSVDPEVHHLAAPRDEFSADLSYLGTFAADRQPTLERLLVEPARRAPERRFVIGGAQYPADFPWTPNTFFVRHLPAADHPAFYASSPLTLNVTRAAMAAMGYCPSGRLFEAAACGAPIISDVWDGLDAFFRPGDELLPARGPDDVLAAIELPRQTLAAIARRARERVLAQHTAAARAAELEALLEDAMHAPAAGRFAQGAACSA